MSARFLRACASPADFPQSELVEIAVVGRSNCGKSSLINALTGQAKLARTSSTPGRTREIVFFEVTLPGAPTFHLVDLPGYGYAKVSRDQQAHWGALIGDYIDNRRELMALLLLVDIRRDIAQEELDLVSWASERELETRLVLTKSDKLAKNKRFGPAQKAQTALALARRPLLTSASDKPSIEALRRVVAALVSDCYSPET
ncbi:MAG: YihA family ribosome biogenesis GTP-binding protein [Myxococcales bacterium]|nr:YihA family ribosome biogenesis GTP-binding protein [Myxococcales bacterium]